jgi:1-phosphofructokinase family hexose kinase
LIAEGLRAESLVSECTPIHAESRTCLILHDRRRREQTVINDPGPAISEAEIRAFTATYAHALPRAEWVVITGSLPPDLPADTYAQLIQLAHRGGRRVLLDCAGAPLRHALRERPYLVKINATETGGTNRRGCHDFAAAARAARRLCEMGADSAMVTLGEQGAVFDVAGDQFVLQAPRVAAQNSVGSGDAALAGLAAGLRRGWPPARIAALAVAAGAANACTARDNAAPRRLPDYWIK